MSNKELEQLINNLMLLDINNRVIALDLIFKQYGSEIYKQVVHKLAIKLKEEGLVK